MSPFRTRGFSRPRPSFRSNRRKLSLRWQGYTVGTGTLPPDASIRIPIETQAGLLALGMMNPTIMRIHADVVVVLDPATPVVGDVSYTYMGIGLQDGITGLAGNTYEEPFTHSYAPWMYWKSIPLYRLSTDGDSSLSSVRFSIDIRSKRRFDATDQLVAVFVNNPGGVEPTERSIGAALSMRVLYKDN